MNAVSARVGEAVDTSPRSPSVSPAAPRHPVARPVAVLGVPFDPVTIAGTIERIDAMIASRQPHTIVTANVDFLVQAQRDVELRRILLEADLVLCDGTPVLWASRWLGNRLPERVAGSDLAPALIASAAKRGHRLFFLGAAPGVAAAAEARLKRQYPELQIVGTYAPPFSHLLEMDHDAIVRRIRAARPDILLVSFGCPKQEKWIAMHHHALGVPVAIGVGATLDFLAGRVSRAPAWMRHSGTEWLYRLMLEPRRLCRRYASDLVRFFPCVLMQWCRLASRRQMSAAPRLAAPPAAGWCRVELGSQLTRRSLEDDAAFWDELRPGANCIVDCSGLRQVDGTGVALLVRLRKLHHSRGHQFALLAPSRPLRRVLEALRLCDHFLIAGSETEIVQRAEGVVSPQVRGDGASRSLAWNGEIVAANCDEVWHATIDRLRTFAAGRATLVIIDLARLRFIDSSGAALMLRVKKWAQSQSLQVMFAHPQPNVRNVLRLTRIDQLLLEGAQ